MQRIDWATLDSSAQQQALARPALPDAALDFVMDGDVELLDVRGWLPTPAGGVKVSGPGTGSTAAFDASAGPIALRDRPWRWRRARTQQR